MLAARLYHRGVSRLWRSCGLAVLVGAGWACGAEPTQIVAPSSRAPAQRLEAEALTRAEPEPDPAIELLAEHVVHHDDFARAELYSWTTEEQVVALRETRRLLVADPSTGGRASPFNLALMEIEQDGSTTAQLAALLLDHPDLRRRRYAWTSPFATTLGLGSRRYGDRLIRIELDPRAILARFEPRAATPFSLIDMQGRSVTIDEVLAEPLRLAALYHVQDTPEAVIPYREYVVCSEAMITAWSIATPEIRARVEHEIELLDQLARGSLASLPHAAVTESAAPDWRRASAAPTPLELWHASLAFDNLRYRPTPPQLETIRVALEEYIDEGEPLIHRPQCESCPR